MFPSSSWSKSGFCCSSGYSVLEPVHSHLKQAARNWFWTTAGTNLVEKPPVWFSFAQSDKHSYRDSNYIYALCIFLLYNNACEYFRANVGFRDWTPNLIYFSSSAEPQPSQACTKSAEKHRIIVETFQSAPNKCGTSSTLSEQNTSLNTGFKLLLPSMCSNKCEHTVIIHPSLCVKKKNKLLRISLFF